MSEEHIPVQRKTVSRREFLKIAGVAGAGITVAGGLGGLLAACGAEEETTTTAAATTTTGAATTTTAGATTTTAAGVTTTSKMQAAETLKIGCSMPFSGAYGFFGPTIQAGMDQYVEIINERGGWVVGDYQYKIEMKYPDDGMDIKRGPIVAQELVDWGAKANVGDFTKFGPFTKVLNENGIIANGQMTSGIDLKTLPYYFGTSCEWGMPLFFDKFVLDAFDDITGMCGFAYDWQLAQSKQINSKLREMDSVKSRNINVVDPFVIVGGQQDFSGLLKKMVDMGINAASPPGGTGDEALCIRQAADLGITMHWFSAATILDLKSLTDVAGADNMNGVIGAGCWPWKFKNTTNKIEQYLIDDAMEIRDRLIAKTGVPEEKAYYGYFEWGTNGLQMYLDFVQQAGTFDPDAVMEKVIGGTVHEFTGTTKMGGSQAWGDTDRIKPTNVMGIAVAGGDHFEWSFDGSMPTQW